MPIPGAAGGAGGDDVTAKFEDDISRTIVDCEVNADQWTLMHRYNKAAELLEQALHVRSSCKHRLQVVSNSEMHARCTRRGKSQP